MPDWARRSVQMMDGNSMPSGYRPRGERARVRHGRL